ncbi:MAG: hypothetical protein KO316_07620 [Methanobacterium sp.]|jgi:hypothetical protein|nr:hypothetical protein [Methanobacterium sp.]
MNGFDEKIMESQDYSPLKSMYCNLKVRITGKLNQKDLKDLYKLLDGNINPSLKLCLIKNKNSLMG